MINKIQGIKEAEQMPGIKQVCVVHGIGEYVTDITDSGSRMGFVISQGKNSNDAAQKCEAALSKIIIEEI